MTASRYPLAILSNTVRALVMAVVFALHPTAIADGPCVPTWIPAFGGPGGTDGRITVLVVGTELATDGNTGGSMLHVGGEFTRANGQPAHGVATWDGEAWAPLGPPESAALNGPVRALAVLPDGSLIAGGEFTMAGQTPVNRIARWDGDRWHPMGTGMNNTVRSLGLFDRGDGPELYAGGSFSNAGGTPASRIARWDGDAWHPLGVGVDGSVVAMTVFDDGDGPALFVGGDFVTAGAMAANRVARWDGTSWSALGSGTNDWVRALAVHDDGDGPALFAGGSFTVAGGAEAMRIARWRDGVWAPLGDGVDSVVRGLRSHDTSDGPGLFVGGDFTTAGAVAATHLARWDGAVWSTLGATLNAPVDALATFDGALHVGGNFVAAGSLPVARIARWDSSAWSAVGGWTDGAIWDFAMFDDGLGGGPRLHVGGRFSRIGGIDASRVARWDGDEWSTLGPGFGGPNADVRALAVHDDGDGQRLYAGGAFTLVGDTPLWRIAKWDGRAWESLHGGVSPNPVETILSVSDPIWGPSMAIGGYFLTASPAPSMSRIGRWAQGMWSAFSFGLSGGWTPAVYALASFDDGLGPFPGLYAGGSFTNNLFATTSRLARWDGIMWNPIGGANAVVRAMTVHDDGEGKRLVVGGDFTTVAGQPSSRVAQYDGTTWSPLGSGLEAPVRSLVTVDDGLGDGVVLYAGGGDLSVGVIGTNLARWNGVSWAVLEADFDGPIRRLLPVVGPSGESLLLVAGDFLDSPVGDAFLAILRLCTPEGPLFGDLNGDGVVDGADLGVLLSQWGACEGCPADLDGDGIVDGADLGALLDAWTASSSL